MPTNTPLCYENMDCQGWKKIYMKREKPQKHARTFRYERENDIKLSMERNC